MVTSPAAAEEAAERRRDPGLIEEYFCILPGRKKFFIAGNKRMVNDASRLFSLTHMALSLPICVFLSASCGAA